MKTRRSLSNLETVAKTENSDTPSKRRSLSKVSKTPTSSKKEVNTVTTTSESSVKLFKDGNSECSIQPNVYSSPIVRVLRSRVVTSDNEDEVKSTRTPKRRLSRGSIKEEKSLDTENDKIEVKKSPESSKKRLRQNLFSIIEENEDATKNVPSLGKGKTTVEIDSSEINESIPKDRLTEEVSSEIDSINKSTLDGKVAVRTPVSARKRSSLISGSRETPKQVEGNKKDKTPKSSGKRYSSERSFKLGADKNTDRENSANNVTVEDSAAIHAYSSSEITEEIDSEKSSVITSDNIGRDGSSNDTDEENKTKDRMKKDESLEIEFSETKSKIGSKEEQRTPSSTKKRSSFIMYSNGTPSRVEEKKGKTPKSSDKRFPIKSSFEVVEMDDNEDKVNTAENVKDVKKAYSPTESMEDLGSEKSSMTTSDSAELDGSSGVRNEEYKTKAELEEESSESECVETEAKSESKKSVKTPVSATKRSFVVTGNKETPSRVEGRKGETPKSSGKRFSFQDSFKVVEMKEDEDSESQQGNQESASCTSESEADSLSISKDSEVAESEEMAVDVNKEDKIRDKGKNSKTFANNSKSDSLMQRAMVMTSLAIQEEKKKIVKTPQGSIKMRFEDSSEDEASEDSEEVQTEKLTEQKGVVEENDTDSESDSDDDVPECMSFDAGKEETNKAVKMAVEAIRREKERMKEQKRKRMEIIRTQKKEKEQRQMEKLKMLEMKMPKRLSEDIVNQLPDAPEIPTIKDAAAKKKKKKKKMEKRDVERVESKKNKLTKFDDYIPLDVKAATKFGVVPLDVMEKIPKSASEIAAEFKRQALFGSRIRREPSKNLILYQQKIGASFKSKEVNHHQRFKPY